MCVCVYVIYSHILPVFVHVSNALRRNITVKKNQTQNSNNTDLSRYSISSVCLQILFWLCMALMCSCSWLTLQRIAPFMIAVAVAVFFLIFHTIFKSAWAESTKEKTEDGKRKWENWNERKGSKGSNGTKQKRELKHLIWTLTKSPVLCLCALFSICFFFLHSPFVSYSRSSFCSAHVDAKKNNNRQPL